MTSYTPTFHPKIDHESMDESCRRRGRPCNKPENVDSRIPESVLQVKLYDKMVYPWINAEEIRERRLIIFSPSLIYLKDGCMIEFKFRYLPSEERKMKRWFKTNLSLRSRYSRSEGGRR